MRKTLDRLRQDHRNFARLFDVIAREATLAREGRLPNISLLREIMVYLEDYPTRHHHPCEELIYGHLICQFPTTASDVFGLIHEHRSLLERTAVLKEAIVALDSRTVEARHAFASAAAAFVAEQRQHMRAEEKEFFPYAENFLTPTQWDEVDRGTSAVRDSAFDGIFPPDLTSLPGTRATS